MQFDRSRAREAIVRKFTNYRNRNRSKDQSNEAVEAMKDAAAALLDLKTSSKGRSLFKRRKFTEILDRRDQILESDPQIPAVAAFQKAYKQMWTDADQEYWEAQAEVVDDDSVQE